MWGKGANGTTNSSDGLEVERGATPKIAGSTFRGADDDGATGSSASRAGIIASGSDGEYNGCSFVGGAGNGSAGALQVNTGSDPKMVGCTFVPGDKSDSQNAWGLLVRENAGGEYINCLSTYRTRGMQEYDVVGDSSFVPIAGEPYIILNISVKVDVADSGATLNIGTTDGGAEIYCLS